MGLLSQFAAIFAMAPVAKVLEGAKQPSEASSLVSIDASHLHVMHISMASVCVCKT